MRVTKQTVTPVFCQFEPLTPFVNAFLSLLLFLNDLSKGKLTFESRSSSVVFQKETSITYMQRLILMYFLLSVQILLIYIIFLLHIEQVLTTPSPEI